MSQDFAAVVVKDARQSNNGDSDICLITTEEMQGCVGQRKELQTQEKEMQLPHYKLEIIHDISQLQSMNFDLWKYPESELQNAILCIFKDCGIIDYFGLNKEHLAILVRAVWLSYRHTPYHNFRHAFDVFQMCYLFICYDKHTRLDMLHKFGLLLAALVHDIDHPGIGYGLFLKTNSSLAQRYSNKSVLENHHFDFAMLLIENNVANVMAPLPENMRQELKFIIQSALLATDMVLHDFQMKRWDRYADIGNCMRPWSVHVNWQLSLITECSQQGDFERKLGFPVSLFCDRNAVEPAKFAVSFIEKIVSPTFKEIGKVYGDLYKENQDKVNDIKDRWLRLLISEFPSLYDPKRIFKTLQLPHPPPACLASTVPILLSKSFSSSSQLHSSISSNSIVHEQHK